MFPALRLIESQQAERNVRARVIAQRAEYFISAGVARNGRSEVSVEDAAERDNEVTLRVNGDYGVRMRVMSESVRFEFFSTTPEKALAIARILASN